MARASILWLMGEYCERVPKIAPDVLRKMAKTFTAEEDIVKLQTVNLAAKLYLTNSKQVQNYVLCQEVGFFWFGGGVQNDHGANIVFRYHCDLNLSHHNGH